MEKDGCTKRRVRGWVDEGVVARVGWRESVTENQLELFEMSTKVCLHLPVTGAHTRTEPSSPPVHTAPPSLVKQPHVTPVRHCQGEGEDSWMRIERICGVRMVVMGIERVCQMV